MTKQKIKIIDFCVSCQFLVLNIKHPFTVVFHLTYNSVKLNFFELSFLGIDLESECCLGTTIYGKSFCVILGPEPEHFVMESLLTITFLAL